MDHLELLYKPAALVPEESKGRLVVVSNRVPTAPAAARAHRQAARILENRQAFRARSKLGNYFARC